MDRLRASEIHKDEAIRIIAVESVRYRPRKSDGLYHLYVRVEPAALVVCAEGGNRVVNLLPGETTLEDLERQVPGLRALLGEA